MKAKHAFKLTRYFSITSLVAVIISAVTLSWIFHTIAVDELTHQSEAGNIILTHAIANAVLPKLRNHTKHNFSSDKELSEYIKNEHDIPIRKLIMGTSVIKIKFFDLNDNVVYSTSAGEVGKKKPDDYPGSIAIREQRVISKISFKKEFNSFRGKLYNIRVLSSYVPVKNPETGDFEGVIETYSDVTELFERIVNSEIKIIMAVIIVFIMMYTALYLIIHHAETILIKQDKDKDKHLNQINDINNQLQTARDDAIQANQSKSNFLANMSHEIRTPLTAIIGFSEALLQKNIDDKKKHSYTNTIINSSKHLLKIINDILDLSKIEAGKLEIEATDASIFEIIDDATEIISLMAKEKGLTIESTFEFPIPEKISTDPLRLRQVLYNFCSNAVKFTNSGEIIISTRYNLPNNTLEISISDTGIGMTSDFYTKIFKPFSQVDSSPTKKYPGTGLGLFLSTALIEKLNAKLKVKSTPGKGSCFTIYLPAGYIEDNKLLNQRPITAIACTTTEEKYQPETIHGNILLAEDNKHNQQLISMYLEVTNTNLTIVDNGEKAVEAALSKNYDLILMDIQMPVMDGLEAIHLLRSSGYTGPIAALTAGTMISSKNRCMEAGCDDFLSKPIDSTEFYQLLTRHLKVNPNFKETSRPGSKTLSKRHAELTARFIEDLPNIQKTLSVATKNEQWQEVMSISHDLKGLAGSFGFPEITTIADALNKKLRSNELHTIKNRIIELQDSIQHILEVKKKTR